MQLMFAWSCQMVRTIKTSKKGRGGIFFAACRMSVQTVHLYPSVTDFYCLFQEQYKFVYEVALEYLSSF